jgi:hypothetical protein
MLTCKGSKKFISNDFSTDVDAVSIIVDQTEGVIDFDGTILPITGTTEAAISFKKKDEKGWSFTGAIDRITGSAFLSQNDGKTTFITRLKCSKAKPLF